jgi:hypothetical protein
VDASGVMEVVEVMEMWDGKCEVERKEKRRLRKE